MKQSRLDRQAENIVKRFYRWRSLFLALLFVFSMAIPSVVARVPKSTPIVQSRSISFELIEQAKKLYQTGDLEQAVINLQQAARLFSASGDKLNQGMALSNLSSVYQQLGQWQLARQVINESLKLLETQPNTNERSQILAQTLDIKGQLQRELGQSAEALQTWQRAAEIYIQIENKDGATQSQINQVIALQDLGLYRRACNTLLTVLESEERDCDRLSQLTESELTEKIQVFQEQLPSLLKVRGLRHLGEALSVLGQPIQSEIVLKNSLNIAKQLNPSPDKNAEIAAIYLSLGNTSRLQEKHEETLQHYQQADTESAKVTTRMQVQLNQLSFLVKRGLWSEVPDLASKIQSSLNNLPASQMTIKARINLAHSSICLKKTTLSEKERQKSSPILQQCSFSQSETKNFEENKPAISIVPSWEEITETIGVALKRAEILGNKRLEADALGYLGGVFQQMGSLAKAEKLTQTALQTISTFDAPEIAYLWQWQLGKIRQIQGNQPDALAAYNLAFETITSLRADLVATNPGIQFTFRENVEPVYRELAALLLQPENPSQNNLKQARQVIQALQQAELNDFFQLNCGNVQPEQIDAVADKANSTTAVFYTIFLPDRLETILKLPQQKDLVHYTTSISQQEAEPILQELQLNLLNVTQTFQVRKQSQEIYRWLIEPTEAQLAQNNVQTLVFVLDSPLRNIPMSVLYDGKSEKYLIEEYAIAVNPDLQLLSPQPLEEVELNTLIGGLSQKPQFVEGSNFLPLENVRSELDKIKSLVPSEELYNDRLTVNNLQALIKQGKFNVIHLATHGQFSSNPEDTFLLLWDRKLKLKDWESLLQARELSQNRSIELLVLSACETAFGDERAILGLAGIAVKAGARSTIATLWSVPDPDAALLMGQFYQQLKKPNITKAQALQTAQLSLLKEDDRPYYWAPYILAGNWL